MEGFIVGTMFDWLRYNRDDIVWLKGPNTEGNYQWDNTLPNQEEIQQLIESYDPNWVSPSSVPEFVTPRQIRIALVTSGISLNTIETMINSLPEPDQTIARVTWEYSTEVQRQNPLLVSLAPLLNLTEQDLDNLFILASTL